MTVHNTLPHDHENEVVETTTYSEVTPAVTITEHTRPSTRYRLYQFERVVYSILGIIEGLIGLRFVFKMTGANPEAPFGAFIYGITNPLVLPFRGLFPTSGAGAYVFEAESLVAMVVYLLVAWLIIKLAYLVAGQP